MQRFRVSLLATLLALAAMSQTASEKPSSDVRRVGAHLQCMCGCKDSVSTCSMLECSHSKPAKEKIARMLSVGMSDDQIIQDFVREDGPGIYLAPPSAFGWIVPYVAVGFGLMVIWVFLKKYRKARPVAEIGPIELNDPALAKYKDQIEKDLADLE
jgi:cytochrome c-type biogenesis protein CcmH/NrfF